VTLESLRANIGVVPQDPSLFNVSIMENLRYAKLDATEEEVYDACKAVALHDKIMSFTKKYRERVGERGVKMSGGEKQRMAIARTILKNPKILILDEATSSVDSETEAQIQKSLRELCAGRTTFIIAHRLSTIINADQVIVVTEGNIVEQGTHAALLKANGHYKRLWTHQLEQQTGRQMAKGAIEETKKDAGLLVNDVSSGEEDAKLLKKAVSATGRRTHRDHHGSHERLTNSGDTNATDRNKHAKGRLRSPVNTLIGSTSRRISPHRQVEKLHSEPVVPTRQTLKPDTPEFVPKSVRESGLATPETRLNRYNPEENSIPAQNQWELSLEEAVTRSASNPALPTAPEEKKVVLNGWGRRKSINETTANGKDPVNSETWHRSMQDPRKMETRSEPMVQNGENQMDCVENGEGVESSLASPKVKAPANSPAEGSSEDGGEV